jgi:chromosome segregation ATPase
MSTEAKGGGVTYEEDEQDGLRARSEQAISELAQALVDSPALHNALSAAFGAREKAMEAQQAAMAALNLPSATDVERLERRLRSFSERLEDVEEQMDDVSRQLGALRREAAKNGADPSPKKAPKASKSSQSKSKPEG